MSGQLKETCWVLSFPKSALKPATPLIVKISNAAHTCPGIEMPKVKEEEEVDENNEGKNEDHFDDQTDSAKMIQAFKTAADGAITNFIHKVYE